MRVGVYEAKTSLAGLIKRAEDGEVVEITRRGKVVAVLMNLHAAFRALDVPAPAAPPIASPRAQNRASAPGLTLAQIIAASSG